MIIFTGRYADNDVMCEVVLNDDEDILISQIYPANVSKPRLFSASRFDMTLGHEYIRLLEQTRWIEIFSYIHF